MNMSIKELNYNDIIKISMLNIRMDQTLGDLAAAQYVRFACHYAFGSY